MATPDLQKQTLKHEQRERNAGIPLDLGWVNRARVNLSATERRAATLGTRRSIKKDWQAAWLLRAVTCIDLTTLSGDDTPGNVKRLCAKARQPVRQDLLDALGVGDLGITTGAVCVYHARVADAVQALEGTDIPVAAVSTGFPAGLNPFRLRVEEIRESVAAGAREIDIVISREHALTGNWEALYDEIQQFRAACGDAHLKTILATGELGTLRNVAKASLVCMMAGADFIKTSTGKESVNATLEVGLDHDPHDPRLSGAHGLQGRLQTGGRHPHGEAGAQLPDFDEGRTRRRVAVPGFVPPRRKFAADRHRAAVIASRHRTLRRRKLYADGVRSPLARLNFVQPPSPTQAGRGERHTAGMEQLL